MCSCCEALRLEGNGRDLDTEMIAKLCLLHEYILEIPVSYSPRTLLRR